MKHILLFVLLLCSVGVSAQVGINTTTPDSTALIDIRYDGSGSSVGVLLPHLDSATRRRVRGKVSDGMLVFDRIEKQLYYYDTARYDSNGKKGTWVTATPFGAVQNDNGLENIRPQNEKVNSLNMGLGLPAGETAQAKLDVNGNVRVRSNLKVDGSDTVQHNLLVRDSTTIEKNLQVGGNTVVVGTLSAKTLIGHGTVPIGGIIMWSGDESTISSISEWALCDGRIKNGYTTPDLRGRFVVGYGVNGTDVAGNTWDAAYSTPGDLSVKGTDKGLQGGEMKHTLSADEMPAHTHSVSDLGHSHSYPTRNVDGGSSSQVGSGTEHFGSFASTESGNANISEQLRGGGQSHENRPPYYVLAFIMRVK